MTKKSKPVTKHAIEQASVRCGVYLPPSDFLGKLQCSEILYHAPNGEYRVFRVGQRFVVAVVRNKSVVTALSLEQAFGNCPVASFHALICRGEIAAAMRLRSLRARGKLPAPHGTDPTNYKYPKTRAKYVWDAFKYLDNPSTSV